MTALDDLLGLDPASDLVRRAEALHNGNADMLEALIDLRKKRGWSQEQVARAMGVTQPTVAAFEHYDNDPKLSTIERYANAVEALIVHHVEDDRNGQALRRGWKRWPVQSSTIKLGTGRPTPVSIQQKYTGPSRSLRHHFALAA